MGLLNEFVLLEHQCALGEGQAPQYLHVDCPMLYIYHLFILIAGSPQIRELRYFPWAERRVSLRSHPHRMPGCTKKWGKIWIRGTKKGGEISIRGTKKGGKVHVFSSIGKKYSYFFPNWLKTLQKSRLNGVNVSPPPCNKRHKEISPLKVFNPNLQKNKSYYVNFKLKQL